MPVVLFEFCDMDNLTRNRVYTHNARHLHLLTPILPSYINPATSTTIPINTLIENP